MDINWNPFSWGSEPYFVLIAVSLILRQILPSPVSWRQRVGYETLTILPAVLLYFLVRGLVDARADVATANAQRIIEMEQRLGFFHEANLQAHLLTSDWLMNIANWVYIWGHWPVIALVLLWLVLCHADVYPRYRNTLVLSGALGMLIFASFPVAPPRLMDGMAFVDTVTLRSHAYRVLQPPTLTNPFAAMPSLHFGWNLLMGIAIVRQSRRTWTRCLGVVMPVMMYLAIVITANHYILDGIVGGMLVLMSLAIVITVPRIGEWIEHMLKGATDPAASNGHLAESLGGPGPRRPLVIAHRHGNSLDLLRRAQTSGAVDIVEADVWLYRGRLEVRHTKTLGPLPVLWDRWSIERGRGPRLQLSQLLRATSPDTMLMLDIKGRDPRIADLVMRELRAWHTGRSVMICSQNWSLLEPFRHYRGATLVHSIGNQWQLKHAWDRLERPDHDAVSIQFRLLNPRTVQQLKARVSLVLSWPVNTPARIQQARDWGIDGIIVDDLSTVPQPAEIVTSVHAAAEPLKLS